MAAAWKVVRNGKARFRKGFRAGGGDFVGDGLSQWQLKTCGRLVPRVKCWQARAANQTLAVQVRLKRREYSKLGFVYKVRHFEAWKKKGAFVTINGKYTKFLPISVKGNTLTHWWLDFEFELGRKDVSLVEFRSNSETFDLFAIVAG
jgi:hypothetical protein